MKLSETQLRVLKMVEHYHSGVSSGFLGERISTLYALERKGMVRRRTWNESGSPQNDIIWFITLDGLKTVALEAQHE